MTVAIKNNPQRNPNTATTPSAPVAATVGAASAQLVAANSGRLGLIIVNLDATNNVYLAFGATAIANGGLTLLPKMGWKMSIFDFNVETVNAIADGAGTKVSVQEFSI